MSTEYLTLSELSKRLKLSRTSIWKLRKEHRDFPYVKFGSAIRFIEEDVNVWIQKNLASKES
jgi:excisionase family DNA binding protein